MTADLLSEFMGAGFSAKTAVSLVNSTLILHSGRESFSTIDLLCIDRRSGRAEFLKGGAADSFLLHRGSVERIKAGSLPVGILDDISCTSEARTLDAEDTIVLMSDGVSGNSEQDWILDFLVQNQESRELADLILAEAEKRKNPAAADDMSVIVVQLHPFGN